MWISKTTHFPAYLARNYFASARKENPESPLCSHRFQLNLRDPKELQDQKGIIVPPECSEFSFQETDIQEASCTNAKRSKKTPFDLEKQSSPSGPEPYLMTIGKGRFSTKQFPVFNWC